MGFLGRRILVVMNSLPKSIAIPEAEKDCINKQKKIIK